MALFGTAKDKDVVKKVRKKKKGREFTTNVKTVVEIKTVGDIPPVVDARQAVSEGELNTAAINGYRSLKSDFIRYFIIKGSEGRSNRQFIISALQSMGVPVKENAVVDNNVIQEAFSSFSTEDLNETVRRKFNALKKLTSFYTDFYERARFSQDLHGDGDGIVDRMIEVYNYMDIMYLYFPESHTKRLDGDGDGT